MHSVRGNNCPLLDLSFLRQATSAQLLLMLPMSRQLPIQLGRWKSDAYSRSSPWLSGAAARRTLRHTAHAFFVGAGLVGFWNLPKAEPASLDGSWRGTGTISYFWGATEHARCRANYSRTSEISYSLKAVCMTPSGKAAQTAILRMSSENSYTGNFDNREYNVRGTIRIVVRGPTQFVTLSSDTASGSLTLTRLHDSSVALPR
jgi:hypothetical protein